MRSDVEIKAILGTVLLCLGSALCCAQDFSANAVYFDVPRTVGANSPQAPSKIYVRHTVKYLDKNATGVDTAAIWVDADLKFVVKWETSTNGAELREIKEETLSSDMFVVPDEYKPMRPQKGSSKGFTPH